MYIALTPPSSLLSDSLLSDSLLSDSLPILFCNCDFIPHDVIHVLTSRISTYVER